MNPGRQEALNRKWFEWYKEEAEWDTAGQGMVNQGRKKAVKRGFALCWLLHSGKVSEFRSPFG